MRNRFQRFDGLFNLIIEPTPIERVLQEAVSNTNYKPHQVIALAIGDGNKEESGIDTLYLTERAYREIQDPRFAESYDELLKRVGQVFSLNAHSKDPLIARILLESDKSVKPGTKLMPYFKQLDDDRVIVYYEPPKEK